jgi:hypothetical protein
MTRVSSFQTLLFLHVPKTAGVSVSSYLKERYAPGRVLEVVPPDYLASEAAIRDLDASRKLGIGLVLGHFSYGMHEAFEQECRYFSILRDPISRLVSLYRYTRATPEHPRHDHARRMSLVEFANSGIHPELENCQTKMLSGRLESNFIAGNGPCTAEDLRRAKTHIDEGFAICGIYEELAATMSDLASLMGWPRQRIEHRNRTAGVPGDEVQAADRNALAAVCEFDVALYEYARERFVRNRLARRDGFRGRVERWLGRN